MLIQRLISGTFEPCETREASSALLAQIAFQTMATGYMPPATIAKELREHRRVYVGASYWIRAASVN